MDDFGHKNGKKSPGNGGGQADITIQVEFLIAVIPVANLKQPLHHIAGHIFKQGCGEKSGYIDQEEVVFDRERYPQHHDGSGSVQGKHGKPQEPAVNKMSCFYGDIDGLKNPPEKAIYIEESKPVIPGVSIHDRDPF